MPQQEEPVHTALKMAIKRLAVFAQQISDYRQGHPPLEALLQTAYPILMQIYQSSMLAWQKALYQSAILPTIRLRGQVGNHRGRSRAPFQEAGATIFLAKVLMVITGHLQPPPPPMLDRLILALQVSDRAILPPLTNIPDTPYDA